jgi:lysophospholipase L1-like esterase
MTIPRRLFLTLVLGAALLPAQDHWVATWATAQNLSRGPAPANANPNAIAARGFHDQTIRMVIRTSIPGRKLRIRLANQFGGATVKVGAAHLALRAKASAIVEGSDRALTFDGKPGATLGPGVVLLSDPVELNVPALADVAVSLYFPGDTGAPTTHATALHTTYISKEGDTTAAPDMADGSTTTVAYYWLAGIDVAAPTNAAAIVTYGDSITDGARSSNESNHAWPALLAARLNANKATAAIGVANMGIGGNRVLRDGAGASALARFDRDVLTQPGVKWVMLLEGINDIGREQREPAETTSADELIAAYKQLIQRAHDQGIKIIGCTLTPYEGAGYSTEHGESVRAAVNDFIRTSKLFDAYVDFEAATRDPQNPKHIRADFDPGDHLHPNDAGYEAMANAIDLGIFTGKKGGK